MIAITLVGLVTLATLMVGSFGIRYAKTTSNFFVASRSVHPAWNAFAICGEYLSAGSFLGLAGLVLVFGFDILWLPAGWTAGYLLLLLFVAAPLRRFGSYTIPEFAEGRFDAPALRWISAGFVLAISWLYLLPQMKGAGILLGSLLGAPYWVGVVLLAVVVAANLTAGGMRSITFVQGFQYFIVMFGVLVPAILLWQMWSQEPASISGQEAPVFLETTTISYDDDITVTVAGVRTEIEAGTDITYQVGDLVPHEESIEALSGDDWLRPFNNKGLAGGHPRYFAYSVLLATLLGTMGLPHVLVRFYTNPDGVTARRTTVWVLVLLGPYYAILPFFGAVARTASPELLATGDTDSVTLAVVADYAQGTGGDVLVAIVAAGAVAALLSTSSGLLIAVAGALSHDLAGGGVPQFRRATWAGAAVAAGLGMLAQPFDISILVGWAFAIAASSFCPLLVLGIWWPGVTTRGAIAGMVTGGGFATAAIVATMVGVVDDGWGFALLSTPAAWSVPLAFATSIGVSLRDPEKPPNVAAKMAQLHLPDRSPQKSTVDRTSSIPPTV